ncbi:MAG: chromosome segregation protein ScpA [archaeon]|nr:chromosome segregation protein ScpA [archaeon]
MDAKLQMEAMEQHLLFHKALAEDEESLERMNGYLAMLNDDTPGERFSDSFDESIRAMFSLVLEKGIDPWEINLEEFAKMYSERISNNTFDVLIAGRLLLMAWKILKLQSEETRRNADTQPIEETFDFDDDFTFPDEDPGLIHVPQVSLNKAIIRTDLRSVTMMDLLDAFEDAKREEEMLRIRNENREKLRAAKPREPGFDNKAHKEDDEAVVERIYQRILTLAGMDPTPITEFYTASKEENITVFVSMLHLMRDGKVELTQETLPYGEIMVQIKQPEVAILEVPAVVG